MLDQKKIDTAIKRVNKDHGANFIGPEPDASQSSIANADALNYLSDREVDGVAGHIDATFSLERCRPQSRYIVSHQQQGDVAGMQLYLGFWSSCAMMWQHLMRATLEKTDFENVFAHFYDLSDACSALLEAGHTEMADQFTQAVYKYYPKLTRSNGTGSPAGGGFAKDDIMPFAFVPAGFPDEKYDFKFGHLLARHGYELYAQLAKVWDHADPDQARNTFQALRERRVALACMTGPQQTKSLEYAPSYWLFHDPLLHAVNMRRIEMGLAEVVYESYISGVTLPLEKVPFVQDDILHPAYMKACDALGETPIEFGAMVNVTQDPQSGMLSRV